MKNKVRVRGRYNRYNFYLPCYLPAIPGVCALEYEGVITFDKEAKEKYEELRKKYIKN